MLSLVGLTLFLVLGVAGDGFEERLLAARTALEDDRLDDAETLYRQLLDLYPQQVASYQGLAEVFAARGRRGDAVALLLDVGRELVRASREGEAIAPLELAVRLDPAHADAHALLGRVYGETRRYHEAVASLERAVELGATELMTHLYLAASYWESERYDAAEAVYVRTLERYDGAFPAWLHYGQFLVWRGRADDAVAPLEQALAKRPDDVHVLASLGLARTATGDTAGAVAAYERLLAVDPDNEKALYGLELLRRRGAVAAGVRVSPPWSGRSIVLTPVAEASGLRFRHDPGTTPERHLPETMGAGLAWLDYDGDGWWDLYLVQSGRFPPDAGPASANRLYRNRGNGTFEDVTERAAAGERSYGQGALAGDVDGDGDVDLLVTHYGPDVLLRNRGDGTFDDATAEAGLGLDGWSSSAALADGDGDGDLDLFVTGYVDYDPAHGHFCGDAASRRADYCNVLLFAGADDAYFRSRGDGTFEEATLASGFEQGAGRGLGVVFTDLDGDHRADVYVANDLDPNRLYLQRDGRFEDVSLVSGAAFDREGRAEAGMGVAVGDVDGDGRPEIAVTNFDTETNTLYRNLGGAQFDDVSAPSGFGLPSFNLLGFGIVLADLDLDGDLDAYVANGHVFERPTRDTVERLQRDLLLLGDGHGRFSEQPLAEPGRPRLGRGAAAADFDGDGDVDVAVQNNGAAPELWRNDSPRRGARWLGVELVGRAPNRQAIGARVTLRTDRRRMVRWIVAGGSYQSSGDRRLVFGWSGDEEARELEVRWPSGRIVRLARPSAGRYLRLYDPG